MNESFKKGYEFFINNANTYLGSIIGDDYGCNRAEYIDTINKEIEKLESSINSFKGSNTNVKMLKGDIAEYWHAGTFNYNAAINKSTNRMNTNRSHDFASVDVSGNDGSNYSMKYYSTGIESAKAQSTSVFERYSEYKAKGGNDTIEKYLSDRKFNDASVLNDPIYLGQNRIIPSEQLQEATKWLEKKIEIEKIKRPEQVFRYKETLDLLKSKIADKEGNESVELSSEEAKKLATIAKDGEFKAEKYGITAPELLEFGELIKESARAGLNAAIISMVLKIGPEIYKMIKYLIQNGEIQEEQFKEIGFKAIEGASEGFFRGFISASITACCKSGILGEGLKKINPSIISSVTVLTINTIKESYKISIGESTRAQLANNIINDMFISTFSLLGGSITQSFIHIPILGYMIGSFVGSLAGSFIYNGMSNLTLSFCVDSGFTLFGLVEQEYKLPDDIIKYIGINVFNYDTFEIDTFKPNTFEFETFQPDTFETENIGISYLRRGVIGINKVGYITEY